MGEHASDVGTYYFRFKSTTNDGHTLLYIIVVLHEIIDYPNDIVVKGEFEGGMKRVLLRLPLFSPTKDDPA